jgi:hypothetical protein
MSERFVWRPAVLGGMLFGIIGGINREDLERTIVLAAIGAAVSYVVTVLMKRITKRRQ